MRYFFESKVEKKEKGYMIQIPFNVWEVCKQRDVIKADMVLDNISMDCELLPLEKGNYVIHMKEEDAQKVEQNVPHKILLHVTESLIPMDQNSPYDLEHPIRKIDSMEVVIQPHDGLCGQSCVAMLAGITLDEAINVMHCGEWQATMNRIVSALNFFGIDHSEEILYTNGKEDITLPKCCIIMEKMGRFSHYFVYFDGKGYDSNLGVLDHYDLTKIKGYMEIYV